MAGKVKSAIEILENNPDQKHINLTDPDAPLMKGKKGNFDTNYNIQATCGEDQVITFCDVIVQGNDKAQLIPSIEGIIKNTDKKIETILADADYGTYESLEYMVQNKIVGYVPYRDMNATFKDQPFHSSHFAYDDENDFYICPQGKQLNYYSPTTKRIESTIYHLFRRHHRLVICFL